MDIPSQTVITVLTYLLPGFITAALVYVLTPTPRPIPFERVVQALIFTMLVQVGVLGVGSTLRQFGALGLSLGSWTEEVRLTWSVILAALLGVVLAWAANTDKVHGFLRKLGITCQTSFSSEWYGAFSRNRAYVVLHLEGRRRLLGWAEEWPSTPGKGHFVMAQAEWLSDDGCGGSIQLTNVERILIRAEDVEMVELMKVSDTPRGGVLDGRSQAADTTAAAAGQALGLSQGGNTDGATAV